MAARAPFLSRLVLPLAATCLVAIASVGCASAWTINVYNNSPESVVARVTIDGSATYFEMPPDQIGFVYIAERRPEEAQVDILAVDTCRIRAASDELPKGDALVVFGPDDVVVVSEEESGSDSKALLPATSRCATE